MAYWNNSVQTFFPATYKLITSLSALQGILLLFAVHILFVMNITVRFRQLFYLQIAADFCSFEIRYR